MAQELAPVRRFKYASTPQSGNLVSVDVTGDVVFWLGAEPHDSKADAISRDRPPSIIPNLGFCLILVFLPNSADGDFCI